jgi:glyoxylate carboligase
MGWGAIPDDHALMAGMVGLQTSHRYGNATMLESDFVLGIGNRWANRHTGSIETYTKGRTFVHVDIEPTQIGRVFNPDLGIVSDAKAALELFVAVAREDMADRAACLERRIKRIDRRTGNAEGAGDALVFQNTDRGIDRTHLRHFHASFGLFGVMIGGST